MMVTVSNQTQPSYSNIINRVRNLGENQKVQYIVDDKEKIEMSRVTLNIFDEQ
jgi:TolB-like protein